MVEIVRTGIKPDELTQFLSKVSGGYFREDMSGEELLPFAMAVHLVTMQFPVAIRSRKKKGVRVDTLNHIFMDYTGPSLEKCLETNLVIWEKPDEGPYKGIPIVVAPIWDENGEAVAALGVFDMRHALESDDEEEDSET